MRRRLIVLRHAKSDWSGGVTDHDRPLAGRGRREAALAGRWLRENAADIDLVVCSSATRARQTWKLVAKQLDNIPPSRVDDRLYAASIRCLLAVVRKLPDSARAVLLIGHNPGLEELVADLGGVGWPMKTSSIAVLSSRSEWARSAPAGQSSKPRSPLGHNGPRGRRSQGGGRRDRRRALITVRTCVSGPATGGTPLPFPRPAGRPPWPQSAACRGLRRGRPGGAARRGGVVGLRHWDGATDRETAEYEGPRTYHAGEATAAVPDPT